jgi:hypothetical protein
VLSGYLILLLSIGSEFFFLNLKIRKPLVPQKILEENPNQRTNGSGYLKNLKESSLLQNVSAVH